VGGKRKKGKDRNAAQSSLLIFYFESDPDKGREKGKRSFGGRKKGEEGGHRVCFRCFLYILFTIEKKGKTKKRGRRKGKEGKKRMDKPAYLLAPL